MSSDEAEKFAKEAVVVGVAVDLELSEEALGAMMDAPKEAIDGLNKGMAKSVGVSPNLCRVAKSDPDLGVVGEFNFAGGRRLKAVSFEVRRLQTASLAVSYEVAVAPDAANAMTDTLQATAADPDALGGALQASLSESLGADAADFAVKATVDTSSISVEVLEPEEPTKKPKEEEPKTPAEGGSLVFIFFSLLVIAAILGGGYVASRPAPAGNAPADVEAGGSPDRPVSAADVPIVIEEQQSAPVMIEEQQSGVVEPQDLPLLEQTEVDQVVTTAVQIDDAPKGSMCCSWF